MSNVPLNRVSSHGLVRSLLIGCAALLFAAAGAQAADIETPPEVYDWSGFYIGLQAGYGWADDAKNSFKFADGDGTSLKEGNIDFDGFVGGGHAGYNLQTGALVFGVEGDLEYADLQGDDNGAGGHLNAFDSDLAASIRGRLGFAFDRALIYATGGVAFLDLEGKDKFTGEDGVDYSYTGWTIGAGIDYAVGENISIGVEYRYTDFGSETGHFDNFDYNEKFDLGGLQAVRGRLSWHFH